MIKLALGPDWLWSGPAVWCGPRLWEWFPWSPVLGCRFLRGSAGPSMGWSARNVRAWSKVVITKCSRSFSSEMKHLQRNKGYNKQTSTSVYSYHNLTGHMGETWQTKKSEHHRMLGCWPNLSVKPARLAVKTIQSESVKGWYLITRPQQNNGKQIKWNK